ncbi:MAG: ABC transporter substrate-binding protein [SAR324 cluster bacterium]|nr:ABC transporter substrate-binding protein [SAR324 cluster bacterium]
MNGHIRLVLACALAACLLGASPAWAGKANDTLVYTSERGEPNIDIWYNSSREGLMVSRMIWDQLIFRDPKDMSYKAHLATSWKWVDDLTLEFSLRKGVKFHNGEKFDADDVKFSLDFLANPANKTNQRRGREFIKSVDKLGPYKVRVNLKEITPQILEYFAASAFMMFPNEYYGKVRNKGMALKPIGTGPYRVTFVDPGKLVKMVRYDGHFAGSAKGKGAIKNIIWKTIPGKYAQVAELLTGGVDWIWRVNPVQANNLKRNPNLSVIAGETMRIGYVGFDVVGRSGNSPVRKLKVRQAISHAINRAAMAKNLAGGGARVIHVACFPTQFGCDDSAAPRYNYNQAKARKLLAEAGYPNGFDIDIYAFRERPYAEAIIGYLREVGIRAKLKFLKYRALRNKLRGDGVPLFFMTWGSGSVNDISAITSFFFKQGPDDVYGDQQVTDWLQKGDTTLDRKVRAANYKKALTRIAQQSYWLPLYTWSINYAYSKELDFTPTTDEIPRFFHAKWK